MSKRVRPLSPQQQVIAVRFEGEQEQRRLYDLLHELSRTFEGQGYGRVIPGESAIIVDIFITAVPASSVQQAVALIKAAIEKHGLGMHALVSRHTDFGIR